MTFRHITICIAVLLAFGCKNAQPPQSSETAPAKPADNTAITLSAEQLKNAGIETGSATKQKIRSLLKVSGLLESPPGKSISIGVPLGGHLKSSELIPGTHVTRGQELATLEDPQYIQLQQDLDRQQKLNESKASSDKILQQAQMDFECQKILMKSLAEKLRLLEIDPVTLSENTISRKIRIHSPINGYVTKVNCNIGKYVTPGEIIFELADPSEIHLTLNVFEKDAGFIHPETRVTFVLNNQPNKQYEAKVHLVNPGINKDHYTEVHCDMDHQKKELLPGMYVNAQIDLSDKEVVTLPTEAVVTWDNKHYVFTETADRTYKMVPVETGVTQDNIIEITSALPENKIVIKNAYTLLSKAKNNGEE